MLAVRDLACGRRGVPVLEGLSFTVPAGTALILTGPNGVGKTTLLRTLAGLQPATGGTIDAPDGQVAYASHADGVKDALSVTENLAFWARLHDRDFDDAALNAFNLRDLAARQAGTLSAGQKRRLGLARLAVIGRDLLLLDEPTTSLDGFARAMFADWLRDVHLARGGAAVIATHVDLGLEAPTLDLTPFRAAPDAPGGSDEAFL